MKLVEVVVTSGATHVINLEAINNIAVDKRWATVWYQNNAHVVMSIEEYNKKLKKYVRKDTGFWRRTWAWLLGKGN